MANINLDDPNFAYVDGYFYTINKDSQLLLKKTFDGEIAFCYTLGIPVAYTVVSLIYDGVHFWSLEQGSGRIIIRKWKIENLVCVSKLKLEVIDTTSLTVVGNAFAVEHYTTKLKQNEGPSLGLVLEIDEVPRLKNDLCIYIGPNSLGESEYKIIDSFTATSITIKDILGNSYQAGDLVRFYRSGYFFNDFYANDSTTGSLMEVDLDTGSVESTHEGLHFQNVKAAVFGQVKNRDGGGTYNFDDSADGSFDVVSCLMFIKGPNMFFSDVNSSEKTLYGSMVLFGQTTEIVYDLTLGRDIVYPPDPNTNGSTIYMLKKSGSVYDYQVAQFDRMVNSISVNAAPAILPADSISTSSIEARVLDQYDNVYVQKNVAFIITSGPGSLSNDHAETNADGVATINYIAGAVVGDATIKATVQQT